MKKLIVIALIMTVIFGLLFSYHTATSIHVLDREIVEVYDDYLIVCDPENFRSSSTYRYPYRLFLNTLRKPANWEPGQNIRIYYSNHYLHKIERIDRVWYTIINEPFDPAIRETVFWECAAPFLVIGTAGSITLAALHICKKKQPKSAANSAK